ncbi:MAG TPA: hypothetical protein VI547_03640 [Anaerolineales bacterium]|nr:hypothetical protein [Anaerolineales bacterium]
MNNYSYNNTRPVEPTLWTVWARAAVRFWDRVRVRRGLIFGLILVVALAAFEVFNFSTTDYALTDLLGNLEFAGLRWATILAIAFCGIDFAGLARLFTPEKGLGNLGGYSTETWYLIGAWFLGATMNAMMTWWAVSLAMLNSTHQVGNEILGREQLLAYVPVFVAALVWITRILIIGTFSVAGDRLFSQAEAILTEVRNELRPASPSRPAYSAPASAPRPAVQPQPAQSARVIGGGFDDDDDEPMYVPVQQRPRPAATTPPAASIRPAEPYRPATRPAPKPAFQPSPSAPGRNGASGNGSTNNSGRL